MNNNTIDILQTCYLVCAALTCVICFFLKAEPGESKKSKDLMVIPLIANTIIMALLLIAMCVLSARSLLEILQSILT